VGGSAVTLDPLPLVAIYVNGYALCPFVSEILFDKGQTKALLLQPLIGFTGQIYRWRKNMDCSEHSRTWLSYNKEQVEILFLCITTPTATVPLPQSEDEGMQNTTMFKHERASACLSWSFSGRTTCTVWEALSQSLQHESAYLQLFALKNIAISAARLPRSAGDGSVQTTSTELRLKERVNLSLWQKRQK
jgi:hypothetical protein